MQTAAGQRQALSHDDIAKAAWLIWKQEGCPQGRDLECWLRAEQECLAAKAKPAGEALNSAATLRPAPAATRRSATRQSGVALKP